MRAPGVVIDSATDGMCRYPGIARRLARHRFGEYWCSLGRIRPVHARPRRPRSQVDPATATDQSFFAFLVNVMTCCQFKPSVFVCSISVKGSISLST